MTETPQENTANPTESYPAAESLPVRQRAIVATDRPARYIKQLGSHMGRKLGTAELPDGIRLTFNRGGARRKRRVGCWSGGCAGPPPGSLR